MVYLYDETFEGFLTCVYQHYYKEKATGIYSQRAYQVNIMTDSSFVETDKERAEKVMVALKKNLTTESLHNIQKVFLAGDVNKDTLLLHYMIHGFKIKGRLDLEHTHEVVYPIHQLARKVGFECHRFLGLIRFQDISGTLYSEFEPDHDIVTILAPHFTQRLRNERFIIHDKKRKHAVIYNGHEWWLTDFELKSPMPIDDKEKFYSSLWKGYFDQIAIKERKNLKLQQQFVPKKYRHNLTEFKMMNPDDKSNKNTL